MFMKYAPPLAITMGMDQGQEYHTRMNLCTPIDARKGQLYNTPMSQGIGVYCGLCSFNHSLADTSSKFTNGISHACDPSSTCGSKSTKKATAVEAKRKAKTFPMCNRFVLFSLYF